MSSGRRVRGQTPSTEALTNDLHLAVAEALGDGHGIAERDLLAIRKVMDPMWNSIPKNRYGRIDRRLLRYLVHRYFMQRYSLSIIGLEPANVNSSHPEAALLMIHAPNYVKGVLEGKSAQDGFSIEDAVGLAATLERLVSDTGRRNLDSAYDVQKLDIDQDVTRQQLEELLVDYMIYWMLGDDIESINVLVSNHTLLYETFADWPSVKDFSDGQISHLMHKRQHQMQSDVHNSYNPFNPKFSFQDVETMIGGVTTEFGRFWEGECQNIKQLLVVMDRDNTGRVKLSDFYGTAMAGEWRFGESKEYLQQLGALDESSKWHGPRVIIPNYLQGANNCIVSAPHYRVCCSNECEGIMNDLEVAIGESTSTPEILLPMVMNMSANLEDDRPKLDNSLVTQLKTIAEVSGNGRIPLHGRLFAQWLHYVFPRECPFPAKTGTTVSLSPLQFGDNFVATEEEMEYHAEDKERSSQEGLEDDEDSWMTQWSHDEELLTDYASLDAPWEGRRSSTLAFVLIVVGALAGLGLMLRGSGDKDLPYSSSSSSQWSSGSMKSHLV